MAKDEPAFTRKYRSKEPGPEVNVTAHLWIDEKRLANTIARARSNKLHPVKQCRIAYSGPFRIEVYENPYRGPRGY